MVACLFIAIIGPLVSLCSFARISKKIEVVLITIAYFNFQVVYTITNEQINILMVVDSPNAPNYDIFLTNAYGDGLEVIYIVNLTAFYERTDLFFFSFNSTSN